MEEIIDASTRTNVGWKVTVQDNSAAGGGRSYTENFDIVAIATGTNGPAFNRTPQYPGVEKFRGKLATQHDSYEDFDNKDVVVLGNGRAAIDMAVIACERPAVKSVTQIIRGKRWGVPDIMGGKPFEET
ncbi:Dimethylaniline monooxygenase N-oxide-forming 2, partial [Hondaea fermentalgiana]